MFLNCKTNRLYCKKKHQLGMNHYVFNKGVLGDEPFLEFLEDFDNRVSLRLKLDYIGSNHFVASIDYH